jgi:choline dehydrogenase-like flavoprotein
MAIRSEARLGYMPHFDVTTLDGQHVQYDDIWQRRNLVLVLVSPQERDAGAWYALQLQARRDEFEREETTVVVTTDGVPKLPTPAALVADRWGEILYLETASSGQTFRVPDVNELLSWVHFIEIQCPECPP